MNECDRVLAATLLRAIGNQDIDFPEQLGRAITEGFDPYQPIDGNHVHVTPPKMFGKFSFRIEDAALMTNILHAIEVDTFGKTKSPFANMVEILPRISTTPAAGTFVLDRPYRAAPKAMNEPRIYNLLEALPYLAGGSTQRKVRMSTLLGTLDTRSSAVQVEMAQAIPEYFRLLEADTWTKNSAMFCLAKMINAGADMQWFAKQGLDLRFSGSSLLICFTGTSGPQNGNFMDDGDLQIIEEATERLLALEPSARDRIFQLEHAAEKGGNTALMNAVEFSSTKMAGLLLDAGASITKKHKHKRRNNVRVSPYTLAQHLGRQDVVQMMDAVTAQRAIRQTLRAAARSTP